MKHAALTGNIRLLNVILTHPRANIRCGSQYSIRAAAFNGHTEAVKILLNVPGVDPGQTYFPYKQPKSRPVWKKTFDSSAIEGAVNEGHIEVIQSILTGFPRLSSVALKKAVEIGKEEVVAHLLDNLQKYAINVHAHHYLTSALPYPLIFETLLMIPNIQVNHAFMECSKKKEYATLMKRLLNDERLNLQALLTYDQDTVLTNLAGSGEVEALSKALTLVHPTVRPTDPLVNAATAALDYDMTKMLLDVPEFRKYGYWCKRCSNCVNTSNFDVGNKILELVLTMSEVSDSDVSNAIEAAAKNNNVAALELLLKYSRASVSFHSAVKVALNNKSDKAAIHLLTHTRVDPAHDNNFYIRYAAEKGLPDVVKVLLKKDKVNPAVAHNSALRAACVAGDIEVVKTLLADTRVNPADFANHPIQIASLTGHVEIAKLLLADPRVNPSANNNYPVKIATERGHTAIIELLTSHPRFKKWNNVV